MIGLGGNGRTSTFGNEVMCAASGPHAVAMAREEAGVALGSELIGERTITLHRALDLRGDAWTQLRAALGEERANAIVLDTDYRIPQMIGDAAQHLGFDGIIRPSAVATGSRASEFFDTFVVDILRTLP